MIFNIIKIDKKYKKIFLFLIFFYFIISVSEFISIAIIIPLIGIFLNDQIIFENVLLNNFIEFIKDFSSINLYFFLCVIFSLFVIINWFGKYFATKFTINIINKIGADIQYKIFQKYIEKNFIEILRISSDDILANLSVIYIRAIEYITSFLQLISNTFIALMFVLLLLYINFEITILVTVILLFFFGLNYFLNKKNFYNRGKDLNDSNINIIKSFQESRGYIQELKLYNLESFYLENIKFLTENVAIKTAKNKISQETPRIHFEYLILLVLVLILFILKQKSQITDQDIALLAAFALSAQKLLPAINKIYSSLSMMKICKKAINDIFVFLTQNLEIRKKNKRNYDKGDFIVFNKIIIKNLNFSFDGINKIYKKNLNFEIKKGEFIGIKGSSGSGKSTLLNIISSLIKPTEGNIFIDKKNIENYEKIQWKKNIALVPQNIFLVDKSINENIALGEAKKDIDLEKIKKIVSIVELEAFINNLEEKYEYKVGQFGSLISGGQKQRIGIARALYREANLILLDEPTSAIDQTIELKIIENLKKLTDKTFIVISHSNELLSICDRVIDLDNNFLVNKT